MKRLKSWLYVLSTLSSCTVWSVNGIDAYREGFYTEAVPALSAETTKDAITHYYLARMRLYGYGDLKNNTAALKDFEQAAAKGYLPAQQIMARYALLVKKDPTEAMHWFKKAADTHNDVSAQMICAAGYLYGFGVKKNEDMAKRYYIAAAKNGQSTAQYAVARSFLEGGRHSGNQKLGMIWLGKAVAQKNPAADCVMGEIEKSPEWIEKAVALNYQPALLAMGALAQNKGDLITAKTWYTRAADQHDAAAELALANLYLQSKSELYDPKTGFTWTLRAAQEGSKDAQLLLAKLYQAGLGVAVNEGLAKEWSAMAKKTVKLTEPQIEEKMAQWISIGSEKNLASCGYQLPGIFTVWRNPKALQENHENPAPQMAILSRATLYQPQFTWVAPNQIPLSEIYNALVVEKALAQEEKLTFPHYEVVTQPNLKLLRQKAALGVTPAIFELGLCYQYGDCGLEASEAEAIKWYSAAVIQNDLRALYQMGLLYLKDPENTSDWKKGVGYLTEAAFKGNAYAENALAKINEREGNQAQAMSFYYIAAANKFGPAEYRLAEMLARNNSHDLDKSARLKKDKILQRLYAEAVNDHVPEAALPLAFFHAMGTPQQQKAAFDYALQAAQKNNPDAALLLGLLYDRGLGVPVSQREAMHWYQLAGQNSVRDFLIGTHAGIDGNLLEAKKLLTQASQHGFAYADLNLAILKAQSKEPFLENLNKALSLGNSKAGVLLADYHMSQPLSDSTHLNQAKNIYQSFADKGDPESQLKLAYMFEQGIGGSIDRTQAEKWYQLAANQGDVRAQYLLGHLYQMGWIDHVPNYALAEKWYAASEAKYPPSAIALGFIAETEEDNYAKAQQHYALAAAANHPTAAYNMGLLYEVGKDRPVDLKLAEEWLHKAAKLGYTKAQVALTNMFQRYSSIQPKNF